MQKVVILGASGSIGKSAADVLSANKDKYSVYALAAKNNVEELCRQCRLFSPERVITAAPEKFPVLQQHPTCKQRHAVKGRSRAVHNEVLRIRIKSLCKVILNIFAIVHDASIDTDRNSERRL